MTILSISNLSIQTSLTSVLQAEQASLTTLTTQLSTGVEYQDLTDYTASQARNLINLQNTATQKQAYLSIISGVSTTLSIYDTTLTDLESIAQQAQKLLTNNPSYTAAGASNLNIQSSNYLQSVTADLNQQINGRYLYSGARYDTPPVQNLATLPAGSLSPTIYTDGSTLPSYDTGSKLYASVSGQNITIGGTVTAGQIVSVNVNNISYTYTAQASDTPTTIANNLAAQITGNSVAATSSGGTLTLPGGATIGAVNVTTSNSAAYTTDQASIDTGLNVNYGISSNNPAMQQLIAGLRYLQAAGQSTNAADYQTNLSQASSLITSALTGLQSLHTMVANNINIMTNEKNAQNTALSNLTTQVDNIQKVDVTQVSAEITAMQTILQASYLVTGNIEKLSIVSYL